MGKGNGKKNKSSRETEPLCLDITEAARLLGLSRTFCYELARRGELPVIKFGRRILLPKVALEKMLLNQTHEKEMPQ